MRTCAKCGKANDVLRKHCTRFHSRGAYGFSWKIRVFFFDKRNHSQQSDDNVLKEFARVEKKVPSRHEAGGEVEEHRLMQTIMSPVGSGVLATSFGAPTRFSLSNSHSLPSLHVETER